jgi:uncharacterized protein (TIGR02271 family)
MSAATRTGPVVVGRDGLRGTLDATVREGKWIAVTLDNGDRIWADGTMLVAQNDGTYFLDVSPTDAQRAMQREAVVIPVIAEEVTVQKRLVEAPGARITKSHEDHVETVSVPLQREEIVVQRVPVEQVVAQAPPVRQDGDTLVVPVVEERLVLEKRLVVREEVRITKRIAVDQSPPQQVSLRREHVEVERTQPKRTQ